MNHFNENDLPELSFKKSVGLGLQSMKVVGQENGERETPNKQF